MLNKLKMEAIGKKITQHISASGTEFGLFGFEEHETNSMFSWTEMNSILQNASPNYPQLKLVNDGKLIDESCYSQTVHDKGRGTYNRLIPQRLMAEMAGGASLVLNHVEDFSTHCKNLAVCLEKYFSCDVRINAYLSLNGESSFGQHWDDHDVFILQLDGEKQWELYPETREDPIAGGRPPKPMDKPTLMTLKPGEGLFVPRGIWHRVSPVGRSLHLTVTIDRTKYSDYLKWVVDLLLDHDSFRKTIDFSQGVECMKGLDFSDIFQNEALFERFKSSCQRDSYSNQSFHLPNGINPLRAQVLKNNEEK
tara:strand:+ start:758 stop:1681 length:924 start_codon:yes stop_codon:yes gene_type:complete